MIIIFSFILGFAVTVAEPDVHVLAGYVDQVSDGTIGKWTLIIPVAIGLGVFVSLSMARIILRISIKWVLIAGYTVVFALALSPWMPADFIPISFDAGGVTTGPMAVTFILAIALGFSDTLEGRDPMLDGFGMIAIVALAPILSVLILGLLFKFNESRSDG